MKGFVSGEERALREILSIIADNAVKYCDDNGTVNIQVSPRLTRNVGTGKITGTKTTFSNTFSGGSKADLPKFLTDSTAVKNHTTTRRIRASA